MVRTLENEVSQEEIDRQIADYCQMAYERQATPYGLFESPFTICPWPGCGYRNAGVDFHIEKMGKPALYAQVLKAWWHGPGIVARCPGCGQYVLFSVGKKATIEDPAAAGHVILPDDWAQWAFITTQ